MSNNNRRTGKVRWFNVEKNYGFIATKANSGSYKDIFFHASEFKPGIVPQKDQLVEFRLSLAERGLKAVDCVLLVLETADDIAKIEEALEEAQDSDEKV